MLNIMNNWNMLEPVEICYTFSGHLAGYTYIAIYLAYLKRMLQRKYVKSVYYHWIKAWILSGM